MVGIRVAVQTKCLQKPLKQALHIAGQLAYDGVQIDARTELRPHDLSDTGVRQVKKMLADLDLRVGSVVLPTRRGLSSPDQIDKRCDAIENAMRMASRLESRVLLTGLGSIPPTGSPLRNSLDSVVSQLSAVGQRLGVRLALQTHAPADELASLLGAWPQGTLGIDLHPAELIIHDQQPDALVREIGQHILHVHAVDAVRGLGSAGGVEVELGRGSVDIPELLGMLEQHNYQGWATVARTNAADPVRDAADAIQFMRSL